jgi:translation initiation factor IF-3
MRMLERLKIDLEPYGVVEQFPKMEGRQMVMVLTPAEKEVVSFSCESVSSLKES